MDEEKKKIPSFQIDVHKDSKKGNLKKIVISPEKEGVSWYRKQLDRKKEGLLVPEIIGEMNQIIFNLTKINEQGQRVGKYLNSYCFNLPANPKSSKTSKKKYISCLKKNIQEKGQDKEIIAQFYNKKVLIYIIVYLRKSRCETGNDVDNFANSILDSLKEYLGDDSNVDTLIVEKRPLSGYSEEDLDFIEQAVVCITSPEAKVDILKNMHK